MRAISRAALAVLASVLLAGCNVVLYSDLHESDVNEIVAALARHDIDSAKSFGRGGALSVEVARADVAVAIDVLRQNGLPRKRFDNMGALFRKQGLISSPLEERARFIYAIQQTLQETLSQIDGVMVARVHVVLPENNPFAKGGDRASSASVFIKHAPEYELGNLRSEIKMVVGNSIEGLTYRDVTVTLVSAVVPAARGPVGEAVQEPIVRAAGVGMPLTSIGFWVFLLVAAGWLANALAGTRRKRRAPGDGATAAGSRAAAAQR